MERNRYLIKNTTMIGLGSIISKITQFIVLSLCTRRMTTGEYGIADICVSTAALMFPLFSLDIAEAVFRFTMDKPKSDKGIITVSLLISLVGGAVAFLLVPIGSLIPKIGGYWTAIALLSLFESLQLLLKEYTRGKEEGITYVVSGLINSIVQIAGCIVFVHFLSLAIWGYVISLCIGYVSESVYIFVKLKILKLISISSVDKEQTKEMLYYSLPLIPNTIMWWIVSISDRYYILYMVGDSGAGLYSVAAKVPALITVITGIFFKAWQMSAIDAEKQDDKNEYTSRVFRYLWVFGAICIGLVLISLRLILSILVAQEYQMAWVYSTILIVSAGFASIQSFLGTSYTVQKDSVGCLKSTSLMAFLNIVLNYFLIKLFGIQGAAYATLMSYIFVTIYRYYDTKKYVEININKMKFFITYTLLIVASVLPIAVPVLYFPFTLICLVVIVLINMDSLKDIYGIIMSLLRKSR